jgi:catechol 2,3-dioxygenase-like lactoylglutathione lyase family enzyme
MRSVTIRNTLAMIPDGHEQSISKWGLYRDWEGAQTAFLIAPFNTMPRRFDHIDLRVHSLAEVRPFYEALLPALGFTRREEIEDWLQFEAVEPSGPAEFFGIIESTLHRANACRIAFWAESPAEVDRLAAIARRAGARSIEGPGHDEGPGYYAVFFEDPSGNRLEICHRKGLS